MIEGGFIEMFYVIFSPPKKNPYGSTDPNFVDDSKHGGWVKQPPS